jgi:hypothetical protein
MVKFAALPTAFRIPSIGQVGRKFSGGDTFFHAFALATGSTFVYFDFITFAIATLCSCKCGEEENRDYGEKSFHDFGFWILDLGLYKFGFWISELGFYTFRF